MHEMAITENILNITVAEAKKVNASRVSKIILVIGDLSSIIDESVQMFFDLLSEGTIAEHAKLDFKRVHLTLYCVHCHHTYQRIGHLFTCPLCGQDGKLTGDAKEFYIEAIEVE